ncbi:hypothetical protein [Methylocaldum gracile]|jgi:hypothetical protein|uniref:hypothetical protein n=1 Tax=Methylocaldum sp. 0917 TaxID=2485163 RepID=UPI00105BD961
MFIAINFAGEGVSIPIPGIALPLGLGVCHLWVIPTVIPDPASPVHGFTTATNQGPLGVITLATPFIDVGNLGQAREAAWTNLHGKILTVRIEPSTFAGNNGIAKFKLETIGPAGMSDTLTFASSECSGTSVVAAPIEFTAEFLQTLKS